MYLEILPSVLETNQKARVVFFQNFKCKFSAFSWPKNFKQFNMILSHIFLNIVFVFRLRKEKEIGLNRIG